MKYLFTPIFVLSLVGNLYAQKVIFKQDFNSFPTYTITGWNTGQYSGVVPWQTGELYLVNGTCLGGPANEKVAGICDCISGPKGGGPVPNQNVFMFTPAIDLTGDSAVWLKYDSYFKKASNSSGTEIATIEISTDGGNLWAVLQNVPANPVISVANTQYIDLSAYSNRPDVRIGFRYNDGGLQLGGWAVDNVKLYIPAHKDLTLIATTPSDSLLRYTVAGSGLKHGGRVYNAGLDTIKSFIVSYRQGSGSVVSDTIAGISLPAFGTLDFVFSKPDTVLTATKSKVTIWVVTAGDTIHTNDTLATDIRGAYFIPRKRLAIEEGTGTWSPWGPRGWVYMNQISSSDADPCEISVHSNDPMNITDYSDYLFYQHYNYVPYFLFDRRMNVNADSFFYYLDVQKNYFGFTSIDFGWFISGNDLVVNTHIKPAIDMQGDFRPILVITEDNVAGTTSAWDQANNYATGNLGVMGGFENKPNPVPASDMYYNFVARTIAPAPDGKQGALPATLTHNVNYDYTIRTAMDPVWQKGRLRAIVLLLRYDDSTILNSNKMMFYLNEPQIKLYDNIVLYPNPANETVNLSYKGTESGILQISITDLTGAVLYKYEKKCNVGENKYSINTSELSPGFYLCTLLSEQGRQTIKLQISR